MSNILIDGDKHSQRRHNEHHHKLKEINEPDMIFSGDELISQEYHRKNHKQIFTISFSSK